MVERANGMRLGEYFERFIFTPLGMKNTTFELESRPDLAARDTPTVSRHDPEGGLEDGATPGYGYVPMTDNFGGCGLYSTAGDFLLFLQAILRNDGKLLEPEYVDLLFQGSLPQASKEALNDFVSIPFVRPIFAPGLPEGLTYDVSLGGLVLDSQAPGYANKGSVGWVGVPNLYWVCL